MGAKEGEAVRHDGEKGGNGTIPPNPSVLRRRLQKQSAEVEEFVILTTLLLVVKL